MAYGFHFRYRQSGGAPTVLDIVSADTDLAAGDLVNLESGQLDLAVTDDSGLLGAVIETLASGSASVTKAKAIVDADAVYGVTDANARLMGATLDISGGTGAQTVGSTSKADLTVVQTSTATEETLVQITHGEHFSN